MTFEEKKQKQREENKKLKAHLRNGYQPVYNGRVAIYPSGDRYYIPTNKKGDKMLGWRKLNGEKVGQSKKA